MSNKAEIEIFNNEEFGDIRTLEDENGKVLFCGSDVAKSLGYANAHDAVARHCRASVKRATPISGKMQDINFIPEGDVYRLITHSKLPNAQRFESWVFDEVIPSIRKHGAYMTDKVLQQALTSPDFLIQLATKLKEEKERNQALTETNSHLTSELDVYIKETSAWEDRAIINALTRAYAANAYPNDYYQFSKAWAEVYRNFEYKMNVSVSIRQSKDKGKKKKNKLDYLTPKELKSGCKIVDAMCRQIGINTGKIINEVNKSAIAG